MDEGVTLALVIATVLLTASIGELRMNEEFFMEHLCDETLDMEMENLTAGILKYTDKDEFASDQDCWLTIRTWQDRRLVLGFTYINIESEYDGSCDSYVEIYDGSVRNGTALTTRLCGQEDVDLFVTSSERDLSIHFISDFFAGGRGFNVRFTSFYTGTCDVLDFKCANERCVDGRVKCYRLSCGDGSVGEGCVDELLWGIMGVGFTIGAIAFLVCILCIPYQMHRWSRRPERQPRGGYVIQRKDQDTMAINAPSPNTGLLSSVQVPCPSLGENVPQNVMTQPTAPPPDNDCEKVDEPRGPPISGEPPPYQFMPPAYQEKPS